MTAGPELIVVADPDAASATASERIATILGEAVDQRGRADWATTGGSTPIGIYGRLVSPQLRGSVAWEAVHVWWGDDRYVPRDHPLSNVKPFDDIMLGIGATEEGQAGGRQPGVPLPNANLHPFRTSEAIGSERGPDWCASSLASEMRGAGLAELPAEGGWPVFDLMLLGIGTDGHLLSVFPGSPAFDSGELAMAVAAPTHVEPHVQRVTLNPAVIGAARQVLVVATGAAKSAVLADVFGDEHDPRRWPAQLALRAGAVWVVDAAAAASLRP
jgi:6-phosphogluconolactonase